MKSQADTSFQVMLWERVPNVAVKDKLFEMIARENTMSQGKICYDIWDCCLSLVLVLSLGNETMCSYSNTYAVSVKDCDV